MANNIFGIVERKKFGSPTKKAIMLYMADKASGDGSGIWVSKPNMAKDLEMTDRAIRKNIKELVEAGILIEAGKRNCAFGYTVDYSLNVAAIQSLESTREAPELYSPPEPHSGVPLNHVHPSPEPRSGKPSIEPSIEPNISSSDDDDEMEFFERVFWSKYPKKVGKKAAFKTFKRLMKEVDRGNIHYGKMVLGFEAYLKEIAGKDLQYVKHLATWLNGEHWKDGE